jgi:excisionase family DNA binding protein
MVNEQLSKNLLTLKQVSHFLNIHPKTLQLWCKQGRIHSLRVSPRGSLYFRKEDVQGYLDELNGPGKRLPINIQVKWSGFYRFILEWGKDIVTRQVPNKLLTVKQLSDLLNIHPKTLRRWSKEGRIDSRRINTRGDRRFSQENVRRYLDEVNEPDNHPCNERKLQRARMIRARGE